MEQTPLRGLERISEELKVERDKCKAVVQDRTKLKIEVDGLKSQIQSLIVANEESKSSLEEAENKLVIFREAKVEMEVVIHEHAAAVKATDQKLTELEINNKSVVSSHGVAAQELEKSQKEVHGLQVTVGVLEAKIASKDEILTDSTSEIQRLRRHQEAADQKHALVVNQLNDHLRASESLKTRAHRAEKTQESLVEVQHYNAELQKELNESIAVNSQLRVEIHDLTQERMESSAYEDEMLDQMKNLAAEKDGLALEVKELKASQDELMKRLAAEGEAAENAQVRAKVSARGREFVDLQIEELKVAHTQAVDSVREHEKTIAELNSQAVEYQKELDSEKTRTAKFEEMLTQAETNTSMAMEIECLRAQLSEMRKQLMKREMEDEAEKSLGTTSAIAREQHSRNVYEGIILELRAELERVTLSQHDVNQRLENALRRAARVYQLEDEVQMYQDAVKMTTVESQSVAVSASEALERSEKSTHEKQLILRDLRKIDMELQSSKSLCGRLEEELRDEKVKSKRIHLDKLTAERRAAELLAGKSRAEALLDDLKQGHDGENLELHRARSQLKDYVQHIEECKRKLSAVEVDKKVCDEQQVSLRSANVDALGRIHELETELNMHQQKMENMSSELLTVKQAHVNRKKVYDENQGENIRLRGLIDEMQNEREKTRHEISAVETNRTEIQLSSLRKDLEMTMHEWRSLEKDRMLKDESINQYRVELSKEKEKYSLVKTQVSLLEDRLKVALQELSVYRSLDVYHSPMQNELSRYRQSGGSVGIEDRSYSAHSQMSSEGQVRSPIGQHETGASLFRRRSELQGKALSPRGLMDASSSYTDRPFVNESFSRRGDVRMEVLDIPSSSQYYDSLNTVVGPRQDDRDQKNENEARRDNKYGSVSGLRASSKAPPPAEEELTTKVESASFLLEESRDDIHTAGAVVDVTAGVSIPPQAEVEAEGLVCDASVTSLSSAEESKVSASRTEREKRLKARQIELFNKMRSSKTSPMRPSLGSSPLTSPTAGGRPSQPSRRPSKSNFEMAKQMLSSSKV